MSLRIEDVQQFDQRRHELRKQLYRELYERASARVREVAARGWHETAVVIPSYRLGFPPYDIELATAYIKRQFENGGFKVSNAGHGNLFISWHQDRKMTTKKKEVIPKEPPRPSIRDDPFDISALMNLKKHAEKYKSKK